MAGPMMLAAMTRSSTACKFTAEAQARTCLGATNPEPIAAENLTVDDFISSTMKWEEKLREAYAKDPTFTNEAFISGMDA